MKLIRAIIQPHREQATLSALYDVEGVHGIAVTELRCLSRHCAHSGPDINTQLEFMIPDSVVEPAIAVLQKAAHTGNPGDGRIFVIDIEYAISIRTNEREA
ncbi:MAG: P-II family nitrogen regulator [Armatimonas sp.]